MSYILVVITLIAIIVAVYCARVKIKEDTATKEKNQEYIKEKSRLESEIKIFQKDWEYFEGRLSDAQSELDSTKSEIEGWKNGSQEILKAQQETSKRAYENYCDILDNKYKETEEEYEQLTDALKVAYSSQQLKLIAETDQIRSELDKMRATRTAAIQAKIRENQIKDDLSFYCIQFTQSELSDIKKLNAIKAELNSPRILSMLLWQTYVRDRLKVLINKILGTSSGVCGIYKITNILTDESYIGQSVDVAKRATDHFKAGLGIDTPANNKLYKAMAEYGIQSFSWELLESCPREQLNEKEQFYIDLYDSCANGYNSTNGNSTR